MLHCFTSVQIKLQFMWSSRRCVLVCKLYKFYVSCAMTLLANKNMYLKIDRKVRKEKELQSGNAIWHPMSFSPPVLLAPYPSGWYIISVLLVSFFFYEKAHLYLQLRNGFIFLMILSQESLRYRHIPIFLLYCEMLGIIILSRTLGGKWALMACGKQQSLWQAVPTAPDAGGKV